MGVIEKLIYTNERDESIEFSRYSTYHVNLKDVSGLSDVRYDIYSINSMGQDGDTFIGGRITTRDIEIIGHINVRDKNLLQIRRRELNHVLNPHYSATLTYERENYRRVIPCRVDTAPVIKRDAIFEKFILQFSCLSPFWRETSDLRELIATWVGGFEFPVELPATPLWEIGYRLPSLIVNVTNAGDVATGMRIEFHALGIVETPSLVNIHTQDFIKLNLSMVNGDTVVVNTGYGVKGVTLTRGGLTTDASRYLDIDSTYLQLTPGDNLFRYDAAMNIANLEVIIYHNNLFLGV